MKKITYIVSGLLSTVIVAGSVYALCFFSKESVNNVTALSITKNKNTTVSDGETKTTDENTNSTSSKSSQEDMASASNGEFYEWNKKCPVELMVVNKKNPMPEDREQNLQSWSENLSNGGTSQINAQAKVALEKMMAAARRDGIDLWICSMYRTIDTQKCLFDAELRRKGGSYEAAARETAPPGTSEHHTGLAIDFIKRGGDLDNFKDTEEYAWLMEYAVQYGFILRYEQDKMEQTDIIYEPWHFRYVGVKYARQIKLSGLCLEEFVRGFK